MKGLKSYISRGTDCKECSFTPFSRSWPLLVMPTSKIRMNFGARLHKQDWCVCVCACGHDQFVCMKSWLVLLVLLRYFLKQYPSRFYMIIPNYGAQLYHIIILYNIIIYKLNRSLSLHFISLNGGQPWEPSDRSAGRRSERVQVTAATHLSAKNPSSTLWLGSCQNPWEPSE